MENVIVLASHHKSGTALYEIIARQLAELYQFEVLQVDRAHVDDKFYAALNAAQHRQIVLDLHSAVQPARIERPFLGAHIIRDPREVLVSGYLYHLKTNEAWCHEPDPKYGNQSYHQHLKSLPQQEGLIAELQHVAQWTIKQMTGWNYANPRYLEQRFEGYFENFDDNLKALLTHLGIPGDDMANATAKCQVANLRKKNPKALEKNNHVTNPDMKSGRWAEYFSDALRQQFKSLLPNALTKLHYEQNEGW